MKINSSRFSFLIFTPNNQRNFDQMQLDFLGSFHPATLSVFPCWHSTPPSKTETDRYNLTSDARARENTAKILSWLMAKQTFS